MFRRCATLRTVLLSAADFVSRLGVLAIEAASSDEGARAIADAKVLIKEADIDPTSVHTESCVEGLKLCSSLKITTSEKPIQLFALWVSENIGSFVGNDWRQLASATSRDSRQFWDEVVFAPNESAIREALTRLSVDDGLAVALSLRASLDENHFALRALFDRASNVAVGDHFLKLIEVFSPVMQFRSVLVLRSIAMLSAANDRDFVVLAHTVASSGVMHDDIVDAVTTRLKGKSKISCEDAALILQALGGNGTFLSDSIEAIARDIIKRSKTATEFLAISNAIAAYKNNDATERMFKSIQDSIVTVLPDELDERAALAKCAAICGALPTLRDIVQSMLTLSDVPPRCISTLLEACIIGDSFPTARELGLIAGRIMNSRDALTTHELAVFLFAAAIAGMPRNAEITTVISTVSTRIRLSKVHHDANFTPQTVALLLRGLHLLEYSDDNLSKTMEVLAAKAIDFRAAYSVTDLCYLLLVARSYGPGATTLTKSMAGQLRSAIPFVEPASLDVVAKTFALCRLRDVGIFRSLSERVRYCAPALGSEQILELLDAFDAAEMEQTIGIETVSALIEVSRSRQNPDLDGELFLWADKFQGASVNMPTPSGMPSSVKGLIDRLSTFPCITSINRFVEATEECTPEEISGQSKPKRLLAGIVKVLRGSFPDATTKIVVHRLVMALRSVPYGETHRYIDDVAIILTLLGERYLLVGSAFRVFGGWLTQHVSNLSSRHILPALETYGALHVADDSVVRALLQRLTELESTVKDTQLLRRSNEVRQHFGSWARRQ